MKDGDEEPTHVLHIEDFAGNAEAIRMAISARAPIVVMDQGVVRGVLIDVATYERLTEAAIVVEDLEEDRHSEVGDQSN